MKPAAAPFLHLEQVGLDFPGLPGVLEAADLHLAPGEFHCLLGRSGCGKTSLLKVAAGLLVPTRGRVRFDAPGSDAGSAQGRVGFVFQAPTLLEWLPVIDNVLLPVSLQRRPTAADRQAALALLARLGLDGLAARRPRQLSGGQQSRVAIARALILAPALLLLDEPFAALDAITREELQQDLLRACREAGTTVLFVTHDIAEAAFLADRVSVMAQGRIVSQLDTGLGGTRDARLRACAEFAAWGGRLRQALDAASAPRSPFTQAQTTAEAPCA